jgi:hypothetical protein
MHPARAGGLAASVAALRFAWRASLQRKRDDAHAVARTLC